MTTRRKKNIRAAINWEYYERKIEHRTNPHEKKMRTLT